MGLSYLTDRSEEPSPSRGVVLLKAAQRSAVAAVLGYCALVIVGLSPGLALALAVSFGVAVEAVLGVQLRAAGRHRRWL